MIKLDETVEAYKLGERYSHSVLDVCSAIHAASYGTGDDIPDELLEAMLNWLNWRVFEAWEQAHGRSEEYDNAVWMLARSALREGRERVEFRKRRRGTT